ncbi:response regulator [Kurthia senegalensis]|uniref:response regulator n=1 Tax=Kurthia senegalensis TaxID=1033740 RepID=UPI000289EC3C|nr:response regulator [Kurthia senegalensis]
MFKVLLIEDDPMVRQVNEQFIEKVSGFEVIAIAKNGVEGVQKTVELRPDLVFMDVFMPKQDGIESLRQIREKGLSVDVIAITAANDLQTIEKIVHLGVFDYIMKPFSFERLQTALMRYRQFKQKTAHKEAFTQSELDELLHYPTTHAQHENELPKGLNKATLEKIIAHIDTQEAAISAEQVANGVGLARVTARRYLDYLEKQHIVEIHIQYGGVGRPVNQYRLLPHTT